MCSSDPSLSPWVSGLNWPHMETLSLDTLSKSINYINQITATKTVVCSSATLERPNEAVPSFHWAAYVPIPCEEPNQRSHSCSVVPSVDKGWALQCGRATAVFRTDGCLPGAQFDKLAEGYRLCLNLGSQSRLKTQTVGLECFTCVCLCIGV